MNILAMAAVFAAACLIWYINRPEVRIIPKDRIYVIDGDTLLIYHDSGKNERIRVKNIDAPEMRRLLGLAVNVPGEKARAQVVALLRKADTVKIIGHNRWDNYGRTLARVVFTVNGVDIDLGKHLVNRRLARLWV